MYNYLGEQVIKLYKKSFNVKNISSLPSLPDVVEQDEEAFLSEVI